MYKHTHARTHTQNRQRANENISVLLACLLFSIFIFLTMHHQSRVMFTTFDVNISTKMSGKKKYPDETPKKRIKCY